MTPETSTAIGIAGAVAALAFSGIGSALGTGIAGSSAVGAWKRCYAQKKPAPFILLALVGAPITQTLYGLILLIPMVNKAKAGAPGLALLLAGIFAGISIGASAWQQGRAAAAAADAQAETGEGFTNYLAALGIIETVAIFVMVFTLIVVVGL
ncbi:MAG: V-type ATP synthase subunit K [Lentisphaerae bacterium]|jgi:V/A-type H+-transporting ATPase subunit K|nr:V-type ATP synthase subunit K [Lentisphaerota bacterium]